VSYVSDNNAQIEYWNGSAGDTWQQSQAQLDAMLAGLSDIAVSAANVSQGERVIDVGCGCGDTTLALAQRGASVWGIDISQPMLALARERAVGSENIEFSEADAAAQSFTPDHDLVFSRFGVMFFADPTAAFANLRTALNIGGRLTFICWQSPRDNPWVSVGGRAIQPLLPEGEPVDPKAPGPFAFADPQYLEGILSDAGFDNIQIESAKTELCLGATIDDAIALQSKVGPMARAISELDTEGQAAAQKAVREALAPYATDTGVMLGAAVWLVQATNNG